MKVEKLKIDGAYQIKSTGEQVIFLGVQDGELAGSTSKTHGFFRMSNKQDTFFGLKFTEIKKI